MYMKINHMYYILIKYIDNYNNKYKINTAKNSTNYFKKLK